MNLKETMNIKNTEFPEWLTGKAHNSVIRVKITPRSSITGICGCELDRLKIRLKAPPVDGKANQELIAFFAKLFKIPKKNLTIESGQSSRLKSISVQMLEPNQIKEIIEHAL